MDEIKWYDLLSIMVGLSIYLNCWKIEWELHTDEVFSCQFGPIGVMISWDSERMIAAWELIKSKGGLENRRKSR